MINPNSIFVDTAGWACLLLSGDVHNKLAAHYYSSAYREAQRSKFPTIVTSNYVLSELVAVITSRKIELRQSAIKFVNILQSEVHVTVIHIDKDTDQLGWDKLKMYTDKHWSLVDATSFILMERLMIKNALTTDVHFDQAGFERLLR